MADYCPDCFHQQFENGFCRQCGFSISQLRNTEFSLPLMSYLNNRYLVGKVLGSGGFGITYKAYDSLNKCYVAIKEFYPGTIVNRNNDHKTIIISMRSEYDNFNHYLKKFIEEASILQHLQSVPNIVNILDYFYENGTAYYVMPFYEGHLKQVYRDLGCRIPVDYALQVAILIGKAMSIVHTQTGLLHRDISPENILIHPNGECVLIDFGNAKNYIGEKSLSIELCLKHGYAPLEQYSSNGKIGPWTDVYSLAATFYFLCSGHSVPNAPDRLTGKNCPMMDSLVVGFPHELAVIIDNALKIRVNERTPSMESFVSQLEDYIASKSTNSRTSNKKQEFKIPDGANPLIRIVKGEQKGNYWYLIPNVDLSIGRSEERCNIVLSKYREVSNLHCIVQYNDEFKKFFLQDLSSNGTYIDGNRIEKNMIYEVLPKQRISLSNGVCEFEIDF